MKKITEMSYGKEAADKFKASDNWFQHFKLRNNISLRRRTNEQTKNSILQTPLEKRFRNSIGI